MKKGKKEIQPPPFLYMLVQYNTYIHSYTQKREGKKKGCANSMYLFIVSYARRKKKRKKKSNLSI